MYNLLDEQWVSVLYRTGKAERVSLLTALKDSDKLQLAYSNPMDRFAVFRFCLALGYWCHANTEKEPVPGQKLPNEWGEWLEKNRDSFNLLGDGRRFFQGQPSSRTRPTTDLLHEIPTANNLNHLNHTFDYIDGICEPCCVNGLLRLPLFTTLGGQGIGAGIFNSPPFFASWLGHDLADSISQNWQPRSDMGIPAWLGKFPLSEGEEVGLLCGMTWLPRNVYLHNPVSSPAACSSCGEIHSALIYSCSIEKVLVPKDLKWIDPHAVVIDDKIVKTKVNIMSSNNYTFADRDWYSPLINYFTKERMNRTGRLWLVGFSSDKAKRIDVWEKTIELSGKESDRNILALLGKRTESLNYMRKKPLRGEYKKSVGIPQIADIIPHIESMVASKAGELAENNGYTWQDADKEYGSMLQRIALSLAPDVTVKSRLNRDNLVWRKPWPIAPSDKKQNKKGGSQ